ncbi:beta/gamma crystallin-related protein [Nostoc sp.]|uniref:beta/gamma crystallin-related protein n=1 Tax=Nostoc sp. TaxID=1180 RepID=UPI002FF85773
MAAVELYDNVNFNGGAMYATDISQPDLGGAANQTTALVIYQGVWNFYPEVNYKGWPVQLSASNQALRISDVRNVGIGNDSIRSIYRVS